MKTCKICNQQFPLDQFSKASKSTYSSYCKECARIKSKKNYNPEKKKEYYLKNKELKQQYYLDTKEQHLERASNWVKNNQEKASKLWAEYYQNNKNKKYQYIKERYHNNPKVKLATIHRSRLLEAIKTKRKSSLKYLGCSIEDLIIHLESQFLYPMSWENHGNIWEIDHIKPLCNFDLENEDECNIAFHYTNLQPLFTTSGIAEEYSYIGYVGNRNKKK